MKNVPMFVCLQEPEEGAGAGHHAPVRGHGLLSLQLPGSGGQHSRGVKIILLFYFETSNNSFYFHLHRIFAVKQRLLIFSVSAFWHLVPSPHPDQ